MGSRACSPQASDPLRTGLSARLILERSPATFHNLREIPLHRLTVGCKNDSVSHLTSSALVDRTARGVQEASGEYLDMVQERMRKNLDGVNALVRCRSLPEFLRAQGTLFRVNMELTLTNSRRLAEISARFADNATRTAAAQVEQNVTRVA
jgi:hypothetical protein